MDDMSDAPAPPADAPVPDGRPGARRKRPRNPWGRRLAWTAGGLILVGVVTVFSLRLWVERYLKSEAFAEQLNATAGRTLGADCRLEGLSWQELTGYAGTFVAEGRENAAFRRLTVSEVRADLDLAAVWDRVWRVKQVKIAHVMADFSGGGRVAQPTPVSAPEFPVATAGTGSWFQNWLPNRTELGPVQVERFDFVMGSTPRLNGWEGEGFSLTLKPNLKSSTLEVEGRSGEVHPIGEKRNLKVDRVRTTLRRDAASLDYLAGTLEDASLTADGTFGLKTPGDLRLNVGLTGARLEKWLPEDWLKRCDGQASGKATLRGDWRQPDTVRAEGDFKITDATLQALPLLDILAKKTQNASFLRLQIKEATGRVERRRADQWELRQLRADAPGLLRLKGGGDLGAGGSLRGSLLLGIVPGTLRYLAGAEQTVFLTADRFTAAAGNSGALSADDAGLLWTRFQLRGTLDEPSEDLSERLARAWFNATVDEVAALSMEAASTAARTAAGAASAVFDVAPPLLEKAPDLINQGLEGGLKMLDGLLPR